MIKKLEGDSISGKGSWQSIKLAGENVLTMEKHPADALLNFERESRVYVELRDARRNASYRLSRIGFEPGAKCPLTNIRGIPGVNTACVS